MNVTRFKSKDTDGKVPFSPFDDKTFEFETLQCTLSQMMRVMVDSFILNVGLNTSVRTRRRKTELEKYIDEKIDYIIIDIDKLTNRNSMESVIKYFRRYKCMLMQSRSYNGVDCFNLKGVLCCNLETKYIKYALSKMHRDLEEFCDVDEASGRIATFNAPVGKYHVVLDNSSSSVLFEYTDIDVGYQTAPRCVKMHLPQNVEDAKSIAELCLCVFTSIGFKSLNADGDCIRFSHPSETKTPGGYFWFSDSPYRMNHFNTSRTVDIYNDIKSMPLFKKLYRQPLDYDAVLGTDIDSDHRIDVNCNMLQVDDTIRDAVEQFIDSKSGIFCIKSAMGTGKSVIINDIIQTAHAQDLRVLIITNRISVAQDFKSKYNIKVYNQDQYKIGDSLICQYDSLHKYSIRYFDIVILDEFVSLLLHSRSNLNNSSANAARFFSALNMKVVVADAFVTNFVMKVLKKQPTWLLCNHWTDPAVVKQYTDVSYFYQVLLATAMKHNCTISCTSLNVIHALQLLLEHHGIKVATLTSNTPEVSKDIIYKHMQEETSPWQVLIFSPTLTVGVSNMNNVDYHFHYDSSMSNDVVSSVQMIKRTRKAKEIHIYVKPTHQALKVEYNDIKEYYLNCAASNVGNNFMFNLNNYGELRISQIGRKAIIIDQFKNILERNHKDAMMYFIKQYFNLDPKLCTNSMYMNILSPYIKQTKNNADLLLESNLKQFESLNDIVDVPKDMFMKIEGVVSSIVPDCPTKVDVIKKCLRNKNLVQTCQLYNTFKMWCDGKLNATYLKVKMSNLILRQSSPEMLKLCSSLSKLAPVKYRDDYCVKDLNRMLRPVLKKCGYTQRVKDDVIVLHVSDTVKECSKWIRE